MDFGEAKFINSKFLNQQLLIYVCKRQVGFCLKFHKKTEVKYACSSCKSLGKSPVTI